MNRLVTTFIVIISNNEHSSIIMTIRSMNRNISCDPFLSLIENAYLSQQLA